MSYAPPLSQFLRSLPQETKATGGDGFTMEYTGPAADLPTPDSGTEWPTGSGFRVDTATSEPAAKSGHVVLRVIVSNKDDGSAIGTVSDVAYELDWAEVQRPLLEHPAFQTGGASALTDSDRVEIQLWKEEKDSAERKLFKFYAVDKNGQPTGSLVTLSTAAQKYAKYALIGVETYADTVPVARKQSTYTGGPPNAASAGTKQSPPSGFPNLPTGLEWVKTADRSIRAAGQRRWQRSEEWMGVAKVLIDRTTLYI
jgi:hypothetical protein